MLDLSCGCLSSAKYKTRHLCGRAVVRLGRELLAGNAFDRHGRWRNFGREI